MKIAIDVSQIVYEGTGVANYTYQLVKKLISIDRENRYLLFGLSLRQKSILISFFEELKILNNTIETKIIPLPQRLGNFIWNNLHIYKLENMIGDFDLYHSSDWIEFPTRSKKVTTIHDLIILKHPYLSHPDIVKTQKRKLNWVAKETDLILADSLSTKADIEKYLKVKTGKIEVVNPGIDKIYQPQSTEAVNWIRHKYQIPGEYILMVGTLEPRKNLELVITAFERFLNHSLISSRRKPIEMVVAGKYGWGEKPAANKNIKLLGYVDKKELPSLYSGAKVLIYPSLYEGFGLPVLEAMACGCPVISSNQGSLKEIVNEAALLVDTQTGEDITNKLTQIFIDEDLRKALIEKGLNNVRKFDWDRSAEKIISLYNKLCQ